VTGERCADPAHKGHRRFIGGCMDGTVQHQIYADPSDYPQTIGTMALGNALGRGTRSWYEIDYEASERTEVVYRHIGDGPAFPQAPVTE
jgi:hypothetical protein